MPSQNRTLAIWGLVSAILLLGMGLSAVLAAVILDALLERAVDVAASVTTLLPGAVYASATVMKVCLVTGVMTVPVALAGRFLIPVQGRAPDLSKPVFPRWGITSIAFTASTPLVGALAVLVLQRFVGQPGAMLASDLAQVSRHAVFVKLACLATGAICAVIAMVKRERPAPLPVLGLAVNGLLIGLFWYLRFHAPGFDQDTWAPR